MSVCLCESKRRKDGVGRCRALEVAESGTLSCGTTRALEQAVRAAINVELGAERGGSLHRPGEAVFDVDLAAMLRAMRELGWRLRPPCKVARSP